MNSLASKISTIRFFKVTASVNEKFNQIIYLKNFGLNFILNFLDSEKHFIPKIQVLTSKNEAWI